jgi:hypothetical protein
MLRRFLTIAGVAGALLVGAATPAFASVWTLSDGFESNPAATWWFEASDQFGHGDFGGFDGIPHTGSKYATIYRFDAGWASVARNVHLTPAQSHRASCGAQVWLQEAPGTRVNIEVINPSTWTYVAVNSVTLPSDNAWHAYGSGSWTPGPVDVVFRVSVISTGGFARVKVDDLTVQCSYT